MNRKCKSSDLHLSSKEISRFDDFDDEMEAKAQGCPMCGKLKQN